MRANRMPLFSVEHHTPAGAFDVLAFNLSAELTYTNLLNCIDLAGVPVRSENRTGDDPLVIAGGHCTYNPEPVADFVDVVVLGDGEEAVGEITDVIAGFGASHDRTALLRELSHLDGVYVPSMYVAFYDGPRLLAVEPRFPDVPAVVRKRTVSDLADWPYPKNQLVPLTEVVHDRLSVEVFRGCTRGCRFCQAGMITRPVRERPADQVRTMVAKGLERSGYDEVTLTSLSTADFSGVDGCRHRHHERRRRLRRRTAVGLPAQPAGRRLRGGHRRSDPARSAHRIDLRPGGGYLAYAPGDQQAHQRG